ncbi:DEAD/DEAH box helicase family protein [Novosphingobium sp. ES2-1]|uniref:DEAD/DEAH box helicase family protein n=1 Tax=Novosphingobium sp. ES2-1 TaxID=2780074 RepID=UPI001E561373|nr:DEAD/DEAH box helicase family protein [Novosphingobium sp. ES2-1]
MKAEGAGGRFLIQHSAGSGKTNSIAWSAHFLADLHDDADVKIFSSVIVVSDRNVIDAQLQEALFEFERTKGVVATITSEGGSKSTALAEALDAGKKIIVCTMQTFPFALEAVRERAATQHKRFAVIADEAHSSQAGETASKLKAVLSPEELAELGDGGEYAAEDILAAQMSTLVAFSGEVNDPKGTGEPLTETSAKLNPTLKGRDIRDAFTDEDCKILLVANKFQTGFDQPLLCGMYVDRRLAGIQAVQTLSRLNRAHPGKDTTYILDFVNSSEEVLHAFRQYHETAEIEAETNPDQIFDIRAKLDASGHYDTYEVERLVAVELDPAATQGQLVAALEPVAQRLLHQFKSAQERLRAALEAKEKTAEQDARDEMNALTLFKNDMGGYVRLYTFLSQIIDYGSTDIEKRFLFYKRLIPLLQFGRERDGVDLSSVKLTHHNLKDQGQRNLSIGGDEKPKLPPITGVGSGMIHDKEKTLLAEIIAKVNDLFEGDLSDGDQLVYVNNVIKGKLLESETLRVQARNNTKAQFAASPTLDDEFVNALMDALSAHEAMSSQALNSAKVRAGLKEILLGPGRLYEALRVQA